MTFEIAFVLLALLGMVIALVLDKMRPGMILFRWWFCFCAQVFLHRRKCLKALVIKA